MCQYMSTFVQAILQEFIFFMLQYVTRIYFYTGNYQGICCKNLLYLTSRNYEVLGDMNFADIISVNKTAWQEGSTSNQAYQLTRRAG